MGPAAPGGAVASHLSRVERSRLEGTSREVQTGAPPFLLPPPTVTCWVPTGRTQPAPREAAGPAERHVGV